MSGKPNRRNVVYAAAGFLAAAAIITVLSPHLWTKGDTLKIMAVTGATPPALKTDVGRGFHLEVGGETEKTYRFDRSALNAFATVHRRTLEVSPDGAFEGTYRYTGIPVLHILEGIVPEKAKDAPFDRPLDMVVAFISSDGERRFFSYGELTMTDDRDPVMLAYARTELLPAKNTPGETYELNKHRAPLAGLRLICHAEPDTRRYLENVVKILLYEPVVNVAGLPNNRRGERCISESITVVGNGRAGPVALDEVDGAAVEDWVRTGHGRGFKGISSATGYDLRSLLSRNFPRNDLEDRFFLFVACDGYRALFSGREIFATEAGRRMMLIEAIDGKPLRGGFSLGPVNDYFVDRMVRALTHIIMLEETDIRAAPRRIPHGT
jgi:hypothetical protein